MVEFQRLENALILALQGEVRFDKGMRAAYAADASNYRQRGGATSLNGQAVNVAVVIDCSRYLDRVLSIDAGARIAVFEVLAPR